MTEEVAAADNPSAGEEEVAGVSAAEEENEPYRSPYADDFKWYVINVQSQYEKKAKIALEDRIKKLKMTDYFGDVKVPEEKITKTVAGKKRAYTRKFFPGYILVQMLMNDQTWGVVNDTPKVSGFVGNRLSPVPLSKEEADRLSGQEENVEKKSNMVTYEKDQQLRIIEGPFTNFTGRVDEVNPERGKVKVLVRVFGRDTPVELDFLQVESVE